MYQFRENLLEALRKMREDPESLTEAQAEIAAKFWILRQEAEERLQSGHDPAVTQGENHRCGGPSPVEECVCIPPESVASLKDSCLGKLPLEPLRSFAAILGPVALAPLRAASSGYSKAFAAGNFVPTWRAEHRRQRREEQASWPASPEELEELSNRSELDDEDDFLSSTDFEVEFERLTDTCLDDLFLAMRRKPREDEVEHRARLHNHFEDAFLHHDGGGPMEKLAKRCWLSAEVAGCIFPNHVYAPPSDSFFPRPLHVAVLAKHLPFARMLLRFARFAGCNMDVVLFNSHGTSTNFSVMSVIFLALLTLPDDSWETWSSLLVEAGACFSKLDSFIASNIVAHEDLTEAELTNFERRASRVLTLAGVPSERLEAELRSFEHPHDDENDDADAASEEG